MKLKIMFGMLALLLAGILEASSGRAAAMLTRENLPPGVVLVTVSGQIGLTDEALDCLLLVVGKIKIIGNGFDLPLKAAESNPKPTVQDYFDIDPAVLTSGQQYNVVWILETLRVTTHLLDYREVAVKNHHYFRVWAMANRDTRSKN